MPRPPRSPASQEQIAKFASAKPRPKNRARPRGRHIEGRNIDEIMSLMREQYKTGPYEIRSMNAAPAEERDHARAVLLVYVQPRRR